MSKEVAWCKFKQKKCILTLDDWAYGCAGDIAHDNCEMYKNENEKQIYTLDNDVQILVISDFCEYLTTKKCGRK